MAEIPTGEYLHRSIDQLRSMNERGILAPLGALSTTLADYNKQFGNDRLEYVPKNNSIDMRGGGSDGSNNNNNNQSDDLRHEQQQQQQQQQDKAYSSPSTPPTPLSIADGQMNESKLFNSKGELNLHSHGGGGGGGGNNGNMREAKPYKCTQCTKAFANSSYLTQHTRIHLGIKPYRCEICQRKFTQLSHLQQHIRTHTGDKPYKCRHPGCQKAFSQLSNLQSHSRCHQTDKPYKCNSCYKCFVDETALLEHIPKHKESKHLKTHICQYCGKSYTQETYLSKHMQKHAERPDKRPAIAGLALAAMNRNLAMGNSGAEHPYWPKVSPDSLAEVMQQQQQQQQNQYDFTIGQHGAGEHLHHRTLLEHHRNLNGSSDDNVNSNNGNASSGTTNGSAGEDLVISRQNATNLAQHLVGQNTTVTAPPISDSGTINYDSVTKVSAQSAFTPINAMPHLNSLGHHTMTQRPSYIYDPINFQTKNVNQNASNAFPNMIALHSIRNYAHQPGAGGGLQMPGEHLLGIGVGGGGATGKDKVQ